MGLCTGVPGESILKSRCMEMAVGANRLNVGWSTVKGVVSMVRRVRMNKMDALVHNMVECYVNDVSGRSGSAGQEWMAEVVAEGVAALTAWKVWTAQVA
jgi:hypothetical protein